VKVRFQASPRAFMAALLVLVASPLGAQEKPADIDPKADKVIRQLSDYYAGLKSFTVEMTLSNRIEAEGQKQESALQLAMAVRKPDHLQLSVKGDALEMSLFYDGKNLTTYLPRRKTYAVGEAPPSLDLVLADGRIAPLRIEEGSSAGPTPGALMMSKPYDAVMSGVTAGSYVGEEEVDGVKCQHVRFTRKDYDWDMWVETGDKALVRKVSPDLSKLLAARGGDAGKSVKMEVCWVYRNWAVNAELPDKQFVFEPPADAKKVGPPPREPVAESAKLLGQAAPDFKLPLLDGGEVDLAAHKGKSVVVLYFWTSRSTLCCKAMPVVVEVTKAYKDKGVVLLALNQGEAAARIRAFLEDAGLEVQVALDADGKVAGLYGVRSVPQVVVVGKDGTVQAAHVGLGDDFKEKLTRELDALVAGPGLVKPPGGAGAQGK